MNATVGRRTVGRRTVSPVVLALAALVAGACAAAGGAGSTSGPNLSSATAPATGPTATPTLAAATPPDATLVAEGGDPVRGQLGSFTWTDSGSDSPWLPGAPIAVGAGETLTVGLVPAGVIASWGARYVPAAQDSAAGAVALVEGPGANEFAAPPPGIWTVEVRVEFPAGVGSASYYWRLEVR